MRTNLPNGSGMTVGLPVLLEGATQNFMHLSQQECRIERDRSLCSRTRTQMTRLSCIDNLQRFGPLQLAQINRLSLQPTFKVALRSRHSTVVRPSTLTKRLRSGLEPSHLLRTQNTWRLEMKRELSSLGLLAKAKRSAAAIWPPVKSWAWHSVPRARHLPLLPALENFSSSSGHPWRRSKKSP